MKKLLGTTLLTSLLLMGCSHHSYVVNSEGGSTNVAVGWSKATKEKEDNKPQIMKKLPEMTGERQVNALPYATAFRMSGNYADNVAVTLSSDGKLLYFPAPSDITADSEPVALGDGWWLNNQGLGPNSVFTKYTFAEYAALPQVPSPEELKSAIIPGAKVTGFIELPMKIGDANNNLEVAKEYVKGF